MKKIVKIGLLLGLLYAPQVWAEAIRVGTTGDYRPVSWLNTATQQFEGDDINLVQVFARDTGIDIVFVPTTWPDLMSDLGDKKFDMAVGGISYTDARAAAALVSDTIRTDGKVALVRCGTEAKFSTLAQIDQPGIRVVENPGGTNEKFARATLKTATLRVLDDNHAPFAALLAGEADVMFTDGIEADYLEKADSGLCNANKEDPFTQIKKVFLFDKNRTDLRDRFNVWFRMQR